jgi:hypothetical protein
LRRPRHAPAQHPQLTHAIGGIEHHRRQKIRKNPRQGRQIASAVARRPGELPDRLLALGQAVEIMPRSA